MGNFMIMNENFEIKNGEVLAIFKLDDEPDEYILYSINNENEKDYKILLSYFRKDSSSLNYLESIEDVNKRNKIFSIIKKLLKGDN